MESALRFAAFALALAVTQAATWSYPSSTWTAAGQETCAKTYQSPINIQDGSAITVNFPKITYTNYDAALSGLSALNDGHSIKVSMGSVKPTIVGGGLETGYTLEQFHFHWGSDSTKGSEHTFDGTASPLELHLVHHKSTLANVGAAVTEGKSNSLAVIGIMFQIQSADNAAYKPIIDAIKKKPAKDASATIDESFKLTDLLPTTNQFYRYAGSLTTPTCNEIVEWTVYKGKVGISEAQMAAFRAITSEAADNGNTFRAVVPTNGRPVFSVAVVDNLQEPASGASVTAFSMAALAAALLAALR